mgnify:FL=1|jgi:hypothetical protein
MRKNIFPVAFLTLSVVAFVSAAGISTSRSNLRTKSGMAAPQDSGNAGQNDSSTAGFHREVDAKGRPASGIVEVDSGKDESSSSRVLPTVNKKTGSTAKVDCKITDPTECPAGTVLMNCDCMANATDVSSQKATQGKTGKTK